MNPTFAPRLAMLALAASVTAASAAPVSRSGLLPVPAPGPMRAALPSLSWPDHLFASGLEAAPAVDTVTVYTNRATFLAAVADGYAAHDFSEVQPGIGQMLFYNDGIDYDLDNPNADPPLTEPSPYWYVVFSGLYPSNPLYNGAGYISTDRLGDPVSVLTDIYHPPITAIGANVWTSDFALQSAGGSLTVTVIMQDSNVDPMNIPVDATTPETFVGVIASIGHPIAGILVHADQIAAPEPGESPDRWPTVDNLVIGSAKP